MKRPFAVPLTEQQEQILERIHLIAISTQNTLDIMTWQNKYNDSPEKIDECLHTCASNLRSDLLRLEALMAVKI